jgi:hypothetical protein
VSFCYVVALVENIRSVGRRHRGLAHLFSVSR